MKSPLESENKYLRRAALVLLVPVSIVVALVLAVWDTLKEAWRELPYTIKDIWDGPIR